MRRLLITGGQGMVGRNLRAHPGIADWAVLAPSSQELDLLDEAALRDYLAQHRPDAVVHAAGVVGGIHANMAQPVHFLVANTRMGVNIVTACLEAGIGTLINLASSCIYPRALGQGLSEDRILTGALEPTNEGYALAKITTMRLCEYAMREDPALNYKTLIPCNLYGKWDKFDPRHSHLLPAIIHKVHQAMQDGLDEVEIWGDGTARREFMYAGDLADAVMRALSDPGALPESLNIGPGHDHSINDYYRIVAQVIGWQGRFIHDLSRPVGMKQKLLSVERQREWGWQPRVGLADGIRETYEFYLQEHVT
ncbi:GDP-L-fucose synthase [Paracoccus alcaliphilus]|uniref:GDP-L-fucose synthase n=1 Tax=Paracoccus alcaliphilus TaxID=34002 RepID=A0A1H8FMR0_9RHOB|nr:GDP-L-fucose synthase [Paracoccus alcaliphilus]WCR19389.1 GDP-L-fucose synthase [Paracoccus alcaliphilus]SEN32992.1 GDP-L-fucose synthase [Paracoccus alcaliphilus]